MNLDTEILKKILSQDYAGLQRTHLTVDVQVFQEEFTRNEWVRLIQLSEELKIKR